MRIRSTYNGPHGFRGARIVVRLIEPDMTVPQRTKTYPYDFGAVGPHEAAVRAFATEVLGLEEPTVRKLPQRRMGQQLWDVTE